MRGIINIGLIILALSFFCTGCAVQRAYYINRGNDYLGKGRYDQAISDLNKALEIKPRFGAAYFNRGLAYRHKGLYDQAISDLNKAIELNPKLADAYYNKALACEKAGRIREAVEAYKAFIQYARPHDPNIETVRQRIRELEGK